ncbi:ATP-binding protein [Bacteroides sp. KH569_7]|uniref:histidine kinase n=1 Tax=Bacteroides muris (ex Fokt et al. 2023) TaxID=2937417 RepID=A0A9X2SW29_9BACE|nr:ATP-binding protein [Bacteroides muris (ex Fokt et al. 2023)]MCR6507738.1 ATP-binding protein [Bacteroides muris (ex Fokt et al. 2023)]
MRFFTNVSHDLRTPLSLIITPIEKLLHSERAQAFKEDLSLIHRNATTLLDEVNQLLDFRKLDQQKTTFSPSYGDLPNFIAETCKGFKALSQKKGISLQICINSPKIEMDFDCNKMQRIMFNLLSNAIKYNCENGSIIVTVDKILTDKGERACIRIADTGIGIKDENKERIFDRFFQEQHKATTYMGSGIGLHIVKEYVALHGGEIKVENNQPAGSIFTFLLPITRISKTPPTAENAPLAKAEESTQQESLIPSSNEKISLLVVEDNDDFREFLISCLKENYAVFDAPNGKKALSILSQQQIQIIISDVMMPIMDGMELCHKVKTDIHYSHIPIILLTARTAEEHILSGLKEGADEYITKPFNLDILLLRIRKLLMWTQNSHEKFKTIDISPSEITISSLDEQLIEKAIQIVEGNMDNSKFSVEELSGQIGMSRSGLYKKLIQITGKSPLEFMRILRLKRGRKLLEDSQQSISQIAYQVGLSPKQFAKFFKEEFGYLPSEYKKTREAE